MTAGCLLALDVVRELAEGLEVESVFGLAGMTTKDQVRREVATGTRYEVRAREWGKNVRIHLPSARRGSVCDSDLLSRP